MHNKQIVVYLCNAIEDTTKNIRAITTDSYAATNKVFGIAASLNEVGFNCIIFSLGRGRQNGSGKFHRATIKRFKRISFLYCHFFHLPFFTHLITSTSALILMAYLINRNSNLSVLVYNRTFHYIPALFIARLLRIKIFLDLEDGDNIQDRNLLFSIKCKLMRSCFNWLCPSGAMIANSSLAMDISHASPLVCHGAIKSSTLSKRDWKVKRILILFGGTLLEEVGSLLLLDTINLLQRKCPLLFNNVHFVVTGKGLYSEKFHQFALNNSEWLTFYKSLPSHEYEEILKSCHIGLSLRLSAFQMSKTTFPSKVIEYAQNGLLVITTRIDDVTALFEKNAVYLDNETPEALANIIETIPFRSSEFEMTAVKAAKNISGICSYESVGKKLKKMITN